MFASEVRFIICFVVLFSFELFGQAPKDSDLSPAKIEESVQKSERTLQPPTKKSPKVQIDNRVLTSANRILSELKNSDPGGDRLIALRMGMIQITSNTEGLEFSPNQTMATYGPEISMKLWGNWSFEGRYTENKNIVNPTSTINPKSAFQRSTDVGLMYRFVLDEVRPSNYIGFRLQKHSTKNNFALEDPTKTIIVNEYQAWVLGVNKGIPITASLGLDASLDILSITDSKANSSLETSAKGFGFTVRGEIYYTHMLLGQKFRLALAYWQSGYVNEFKNDAIEYTGKQNQVQSYRMISGSLGVLF